jgi:hypothetical protein
MKLTKLAKSIALTSTVMSLGVSFIALSANNATKISGTMSSVYNSQFDEADMIASKLSDIRVATMAYWTANQAWPTSLNDIITNSFYFSSFNTTTGYSVTGGEGTNSYLLQLNVDNVEVGKYLANKVNGTYSAGIMTLQYALPVASIQSSVSLARYDNPDDVDASTMYTELDMGGNDILNVKSIVALGDLTITSALGSNTFLLSETAFQMNGDDIITAGNINNYVSTDADTLDGLDSTVFLRNDITAAQTVRGDLDLYGSLNFRGIHTIDVVEGGGYLYSKSETSYNTIGQVSLTQLAGNQSSYASLYNTHYNRSARILSYIDDDLSKVELSTNGGYLTLASDNYDSNETYMDVIADKIRFFGYKDTTRNMAIDFRNNNFKINGFDIITANNIAAYAPTDADTLDGIDSTQFARLDQTNTFSGRLSLEDGATIKGAISLVNSLDVEYASITDADISFSGANVWATGAQLSVAGISVGTINATSVTADTVTANTTLAVNGVDVGLWISNCEAGTSPGCSL